MRVWYGSDLSSSALRDRATGLLPAVHTTASLPTQGMLSCIIHTPINGPVDQKGKTNLDFTEARDSEWQWHQLGHRQVCTSLQTDNHASTPPPSFFTGGMSFLLPSQQCKSTEGSCCHTSSLLIHAALMAASAQQCCTSVSTS